MTVRYVIWVKWLNDQRTKTEWVARSSYAELADAEYNFDAIVSVPAEIRQGDRVIARNGVTK